MQIITEQSLRYFSFWSGAVSRASSLTCEELDAIERELEATGETYTDVQINDLFWFDFPFVCSLIGLELDENEDPIRD